MPGKGAVTAIIVAAGASQRMGFDKLFYRLDDGVAVLRRTVSAFDTHPEITSLVVVAGENRPAVEELFREQPPQKPLAIITGGATRAASVAAGLQAADGAQYIAIHDAARPFVSAALISRTLAAAQATGAAAPALTVKDTIKQEENGFVTGTIPRSTLAAVQTPQIFERAVFVAALADVPEDEYPALTDDCMVIERAGGQVRLVDGEEGNYKITTPADLPAQAATAPGVLPRIGHGYDVHCLVAGRLLVLGGVTVPFERGLLGHSDADVLLHAVSDALLGAAALGDIGRHFPDSDTAYKDANSLQLLQKVAALVRAEGYTPVNVDATILCQAPKLAPYLPQMRQNIADALEIATAAVSVKATTEEGLGFTGAGEGIAAHAVVLLAGRCF